MQDYLQLLKLSLLNIGYEILDHKWNYDNIISPFSRLYYITSGNAKIHHNNKVFHLKPNHMYLIPSHSYSRYQCDNYHEQYYVHFLEEVANDLSVYTFKKFKYEIKATPTDLIYFKRLLAINPKRRLGDNASKNHGNKVIEKNNNLNTSEYLETQGILSVLFSKFIENSNREEKLMIKGSVEKSIIYISENLHRKLTVKNVASYCHLSVDYFSRNFEENFGIRPIKYIQTKRIQRAQLLLITTDDSLTDVMEKIGIENKSYFIKIFKKITGKTPNNFRKEQLKI